MSKVHAVLLVPAEGDPLGLLREGARVAGLKGVPGQERWELGWRVSDGQGGYMAAWDSGTFNNLHETLALVLAWDGEPVAEGCNRLAEVPVWSFAEPHWPVGTVLACGPEFASRLRSRVDANGLGTLILLDADSREIGGRMLERVNRCPYCGREVNRSSVAFFENPYCSQCLAQRLQEASEAIGPTKIVLEGHYLRHIVEAHEAMLAQAEAAPQRAADRVAQSIRDLAQAEQDIQEHEARPCRDAGCSSCARAVDASAASITR